MKRTWPIAMILALLLALPACGREAAAERAAAGSESPGTARLSQTDTPAFSDIPADAEYADAVKWCQENGIMNGVSSTVFDPDGTLTRAMLATVLYRTEGKPAVAGAPAFTDTQPGAWYADAVVWASEKGLIRGYGNGLFGADAPVTREQLTVILQRCRGEEAVWTGSPSLAVPATRAEVAVALFQNLSTNTEGEAAMDKITLSFNGRTYSATLESNPSARAFAKLLGNGPLIVSAHDYGSFEKVGSLGTELPRTDTQITTSPGDIILYQGDQITVYYAQNTWSFTRLGRIDDPGGLREALGSGDVEITFQLASAASLPYDGVYPRHEPYGTAVGAMPGRVVWTHDPNCVEWDGRGWWWEPSHFDETAMQAMVDHGIACLGGQETARAGWSALFQAHNQSRGKAAGYASGEKIAIKANINGSAVMDDDTSGETAMSYTNPVLLKALLTSLVEEAGVRPADITVYDVSRLFPDYMVDLCTQGNLNGVRFVGRNNSAVDESAPIQWSHSFSGKVNYLPTCVTQAEYVINLANLKGHSYGITLCGKNHFGSFINGNLMRPPEGANLHQWLTRNEMGLYSPLVDLTANADLGGKTVLYMLDAIICAPSEGAAITGDNSRWQQEPFNGHYTASVFVSQDPVAIDSVGADFLMNEPAVTSRNSSLRNNPTVENYLHEAGLVGRAPSGTTYTDGRGNAVANLGVHEHWNNSTDKQYSRNLGKNVGIELIYLKK